MGKRNNVIEIKGIVRNTKDSGTRDGESDEVIGMRLKDGSWRPVGALKMVEGSNGLVNGLQKVWIHRNRYAHILAIDSLGRLVWAGNMVDGTNGVNEVEAFSEVEVIERDTVSSANVKDVVLTQTGHLVAVKSSLGMRYYIFRSAANTYENMAVDFNTVKDYNLLPFGTVDFKVETVEDSLGRAVWFGTTVPNSGVKSAWDTSAEASIVKTSIKKTQGCVKQLGLFTGAFMVCTAAELYDGSYMLMSRPQVMCPPNYATREKMGGWNTELRANPTWAAGTDDAWGKNRLWSGASGVCDTVLYTHNGNTQDTLGDDTTCLNDIRMGKITSLPWMGAPNGDSDTWGNQDNYILDASKGMLHYNYDPERVPESTFSAISCDVWHVFNHFDGVNQTLASFYQLNGKYFIRPRLLVKNLKPLCQMECVGDYNADSSTCYTTANKLYFKVNTDISDEYRDVVKNIVVFATREVDMLYLDGQMQKDIFVVQPYSNNPNSFAGYQWNCRSFENVKKELMKEPLMYKIGEIDINDFGDSDKRGKWIELEIEEGVLENLVSQERLRVDSVGRNMVMPRVAFPYNGRLHLANYDERLFEGWLLRDFFHWGGNGQYEYKTKTLEDWSNSPADGYIKVTLEDSDVTRTVVRKIQIKNLNIGFDSGRTITPGTVDPGNIKNTKGLPAGYKYSPFAATAQSLGPMLSYPDKRAKEMEIYLRDQSVTAGQNNVFHLTVALEAHDWYNMAYYINTDFKPIDITYTEENRGEVVIPDESNIDETYPNKMKVSRVDNPLYFPDEYTYLVGNGEIKGFAANAETLVGGQLGDAPLYVMCSDGVYGMFVDSTGQFTYSNSREISRYVCSNAQGIKAILGGVVMPTDWGLVMLNGLQGKDVSDVVEGVPFDIETRLPEAWTCINHQRLVELRGMVGGDFVEFLKTVQSIGFNYYDKELWVMGTDYSYVLGEEGGWTKRKETGVQLVEDFPNLYMLKSDGRLYDLQREDKTEATECMIVSRMVKADTQEFKQTERLVVRGEFALADGSEIAEVKELTSPDTPSLMVRVWVENPQVTQLNQTSGLQQRISGEVQYEAYYQGQPVGVKLIFAFVERSSEIALSGSGALLPWGETETTFGNALKAKAEMWDGTVLRKEWTKLEGADDYYPVFRFDNEGKPHVKFGNGSAYKASIEGNDQQFYMPEGWDGKYTKLMEVLIGNTGITDNHKILHKHGASPGSFIFEYDWSQGAASNQETINPAGSSGNNFKCYLVSGATEKNVQEITAWAGTLSDVFVGCHDMAIAMQNKTGGWSDVKKNNRVTLTAGNVMSLDGMEFSVSAAQAGTYAYHQIESNVANGVFGKSIANLGMYKLQAGKCYRLGANGDVFLVIRGGLFAWDEIVYKVASGEFAKIDVASGSDTVVLIPGWCYWFKFKNVVGSENIDTKARWKGSSAQVTKTIAQIESLLTDTASFEVLTTGLKVDVSSLRTVTAKRGVVKARWKSGGTVMEKSVYVPNDTTRSITDMIAYVQSLSPYVPTEGNEPKVGLYLFGSYDGYKWKMLGARERGGAFRDLGLEAHRVDCKYFRLVICGKLLSGSSIEYIEQEVKERLYEGKIR